VYHSICSLVTNQVGATYQITPCWSQLPQILK